MRKIVEEFNVYTFKEADKELRDKIRDYILFNWDIYEYCMMERLDTLKKLAEYVNGTLDYSLSCVPSRGEFITIKDYDSELMEEIAAKCEEYPLTGVCYDYDLLVDIKLLGLDSALSRYIDSMHKEYRYMLTDEYLIDMCEANNYEFTIDGKLH